MGWLSLVFGIVSIVALGILVALLPDGGQWALGLSGVAGLIGAVTGFFARKQAPSGPAKAGLTLSVLGLVLVVLLALYLTSSPVETEGPVSIEAGAATVR